MNKQQSGFTLIELVAVIVLLGILSVTALPKFIDLQSDARTETLEGVQAAMQGAASQVYAKALIKGVESIAETAGAGVEPFVVVNGQEIKLDFGYPIETDLDLVLDLSPELVVEDTVNNRVRIGYLREGPGTTVTQGECYKQYSQAASATAPPTYSEDIDQC